MIDGSEKRKRQLAFELQSLRVFEKRSNFQKKIAETLCLTHSLTHSLTRSGNYKRGACVAGGFLHLWFVK